MVMFDQVYLGFHPKSVEVQVIQRPGCQGSITCDEFGELSKDRHHAFSKEPQPMIIQPIKVFDSSLTCLMQQPQKRHMMRIQWSVDKSNALYTDELEKQHCIAALRVRPRISRKARIHKQKPAEGAKCSCMSSCATPKSEHLVASLQFVINISLLSKVPLSHKPANTGTGQISQDTHLHQVEKIPLVCFLRRAQAVRHR